LFGHCEWFPACQQAGGPEAISLGIDSTITPLSSLQKKERGIFEIATLLSVARNDKE